MNEKYKLFLTKIKTHKKIKNSSLKKIIQKNKSKSNITIVIGGDWFMLQTLKKNKKSKKTFLWNKFWKLWIFNE